ncbi:MAG: 2-dehydro-3-deoxygalactonokinase [Betaproteobacteria bacterium]
MAADIALIAIDWGTTSMRAYWLDATGSVIRTRNAPHGIQQIRDGGFDAALTQLVGDADDATVPHLACGMIGSRQGWVEAPYVACPALLTALVNGIVKVPGARLHIVPGVSTRDSRGIPDVMRGEETQIVGAVDEREPRVLTVLPGTHSKWALVESGHIVDFMSFMTGELWSVLLRHSILGRLAVPVSREAPPGAAYVRGVRCGLGPGGLGHDIFGARTLALMGELADHEVGDWLSGVLIGREVRNARTWAQRHGYDASRVRLVGDDALVTRYVAALAEADIGYDRADSGAAAIGLWRLATLAGLVQSLH